MPPRSGGGLSAPQGGIAAVPRDVRYPLGAGLVILAALALSSGGVLIRHIDGADGWQILFYRSFTGALTIFAVLVLRYRRSLVAAFRRVGAAGVLGALFLGAAFACFVWAVVLTSVANVALIGSTSPLFAASLAWLVLGERVGRSVALAGAGALLGITVMFADSVSGGGWDGNLVALGLPFSFAIVLIVFRRRPTIDMLPATCLAALVAMSIGAVMVDGFTVSRHDAALASLLGVLQIGLGFSLITIGSRWVPAAEVALLLLLEAILSPIWVWVWADEIPRDATLIGGGFVLAAVTGQAIQGVRRERARRTAR